MKNTSEFITSLHNILQDFWKFSVNWRASGPFQKNNSSVIFLLNLKHGLTKWDVVLISEQFNDMRRCSSTYYITVIVDTKLDKIVGAGTMVQERKFIHQCGSVRKILLIFFYEISSLNGHYWSDLNKLCRHLRENVSIF